jgi:hypothetical protein
MELDLNVLARKAFALAIASKYPQFAPKEESVTITGQLSSSDYECQWTDGVGIIRGIFYAGDADAGSVCIVYHESGFSQWYPYSRYDFFGVDQEYAEYLASVEDAGIARESSSGQDQDEFLTHSDILDILDGVCG